MDAKATAATAGQAAGIDVMSFDDRRAQLKTIVEQLDQADGRSQSLRIEAGRHLYALRMQWPDGVYGPSIRMLGIKHLKKAAAYIAEYCAAFGKPLPPAMQARKDAKEQNTTQSDDTAKVSNVRNENGLSDAGAFYVPDATPEQLAAMRAADGVDADGELVDDFEGELGSDLDPEEESDEATERRSDEEEGTEHAAQSTDEPTTAPVLDHAAIAEALQADRVEHVSQRPHLMTQIGPALSARLASRGVSSSASGTSAAPINNDAILPRRMINAMRGEPYTVPSFTPEERERIGNTTSIVIGAPRSAPVTGEQMRLDDLYLAAETCQGRIREIKAALSTQLDGPQREAVERAFAAVEQAHAMLVIGGGR